MAAERDIDADNDFFALFEAQARRIVQRQNNGGDLASPLKGTDREIELTLSHMDSWRKINKHQIQSLLENDCLFGTELIQMEARTPRYSPYRFPEREKLLRRVLMVETERRRAIQGLEEKLQPLREKLLDLLVRRSYLDI